MNLFSSLAGFDSAALRQIGTETRKTSVPPTWIREMSLARHRCNPKSHPEMKFIFPCLLLLFASLPLAAQGVSTEPVGFNKVTCLANSDTIVGVPLRVQGSRQSVLAAAPSVSGDFATLTLQAGSLPALTKHYLKFNGGTRDGRWYDITANTANTVTINLNTTDITGALDGVVSGNSVLIAEYWTLDTLFPPALATTNAATTGHAIVASINTVSAGRRTELRLKKLDHDGINPPYFGRYYIHNGLWKLSGAGNANQGSLVIAPDSFLTISHPSSVTQSTVYRTLGEVEPHAFSIPLFSIPSGPRDNVISIPRPVPVTLEALNLRQSGAFMASTNTLATGRRDQLLVFNNEVALLNKTPSAVYYVHNGIWKASGGGNTDQGTQQIPAGAGFVIRKYQTDPAATAFWKNTPSY